jgi:hypothetical protein
MSDLTDAPTSRITLSAGDPGNFLLIVFLGVALGFAAAVLIERGRRY